VGHFESYQDLPKNIRSKKRQNVNVKNIVRPVSKANDKMLLMMNERAEEDVIQ